MQQTNPEIFKNNMSSLQKFYPDLALMLSMIEIKNYKIIQNNGSLPNLVLNNEIYYIGNVKEFCENQFKEFELENVKIPVFLGMGLGYEVHYWMQNKSKEYGSQALIIFEKEPEIFMCAMNVTDLRPIIENPHIHLFIGLEPQTLYTLLRNHFSKKLPQMLMCGALQPVFTFQNMKIDKAYYMRVLQVLFEAIYHTIQNYGNSPGDSLIGLENMLDNVNQIVKNPGINLLYDKFKDKPAIIVATGPSLKKNMNLLKGLEDKALILSVDASFKFLMQNGIKPHMVTSLEREHEVEQFFNNFESEDVKNVYMTACPVLYNHVYESYNGPQIIVYRNFDHFKWLKIEKGILDIKLSSSNMAFKIAERLGCNPIILIGQDFAYGENDETHATEVPFSSESEGIFYTKGNYVEKIKTNSGWYNFMKAFEMDIAQYNGLLSNNSNIYKISEPILLKMKENLNIINDEETKNILSNKIKEYLSKSIANNKKVINCTEGGAYIQGTEISTFEETIKKYITDSFDPLNVIKTNLKKFKKTDEEIEKLKEIVEITEKEVKGIIENCEKAEMLCLKYKEEIESDISNERLQEIRKEIIQPRIDIQTKYSDTFQKFLMHVVQSYHLKFEMDCTMNCRTPKDYILKFIEWYQNIGQMCKICLKSLENAKEKLYGIS